MLRIFTNPLTKQSCTKFISEQNCKLTFFQYSHSSGHCTYISISLSYTYRVRVCSNNSVIVYRQIMHQFGIKYRKNSAQIVKHEVYTRNICTNYALVLKIKSKMGELVQLNGLLFLTAEKTMGCTSNKMALTTISEDEKRLVKDSWNLFVSRGDFSDTGSHMYKV